MTASLSAPTLDRTPSVRRRPRARTYDVLVNEGMKRVSMGELPSVTEVAAKAGVPRATAYRYFPTQNDLLQAVVMRSLGAVTASSPVEGDGHANLRRLFRRTFPRFVRFESQFRAALLISLQQQFMDRATQLKQEPFRRGNRRAILDHAARPLLPQLGAARYRRLLKALSLVYGIELYVVLKDIWGTPEREIREIANWTVDALVKHALDEAAPRRRR